MRTGSGKGHTLSTIFEEVVTASPLSESYMEHLATFFKRCEFTDISLSEITRAHWVSYRTLSLKTMKPISFVRHAKAIRALIQWAIDTHNLSVDLLEPLTGTEVKAKNVRRTRRLFEPEELALRGTLSQSLNAALTILLETGMRVGEVTALDKTWWQGDLIYLPAKATKTKNPRTIALSPRAKEAERFI
jgi:integrase